MRGNVGASPRFRFGWALLLAAAVLALHILRYRDFLADDALISLRYAQRLIEGHGLTWTEGPRVEGYSNLLWTLIAAGLGAVGIDLVAAARGLGVASATALLAIVMVRAREAHRVSPALAAGLVVSLSGPVAVWAGSGLETVFVAALMAWAMVLILPLGTDAPRPERSAFLASIPLALLVLTRPDGALITAALAGALVVMLGPKRRTLRLALALASLPIAAWLGSELFRLLYYHAWVPNSARVKIAFTTHRLSTGFHYLGGWLSSAWPLALLGAAGVLLARGRPERVRAGLIVIPTMVWMGYVVAIGGDFFPGYRHLAPLIGLLALLASHGTAHLWRLWGPRRALAIVVVLLVSYGLLQLRHVENTRAARETWVWGAREISRVLRSSFAPAQPLMAVTAAGSFPYWTGFPSLDMLGLNDAHIARHAPKDFGQGWAGHELGDADYVLERAPDLIQFSAIRRSEETGYFRVEQDLVRAPEFQTRYRLVTFSSSSPHDARWRIWVRWESPRIGVTRTPDGLRIPGFLLTLNPTTEARLDGEGRLGAVVLDDRPAGIGKVVLAPGRWSISLDSDSPELMLATRPLGASDFVQVTVPPQIRVDEGAPPLDLLVVASAGRPVHVREVFLRRMGED